MDRDNPIGPRVPFPPIDKTGPYRPSIPPNLPDYEAARARFRWDLPGPTLNIAHEALDRQLDAGLGPKLALRFLGRDRAAVDYTYDSLTRAVNRCANAFARLGIARDARVFALLGREPALHIAALAALKSGRTFCPLFSAFGPEPLHMRLSLGEASVLVTTDLLYERKIAPLRDRLPRLTHVLVQRTAGRALPPGTLDFEQELATSAAQFETVATSPEDVALLHFTSGTTGMPKGVLHVHAAVIAHRQSARLALDLQDADRYWCTADPGWVTGLAYGVIAPLTCGVTSVIDHEEFDAERWYQILAEQQITVWYTAPTAIRLLMKAGLDLARAHSYPKLRFLASVGEPLNPAAVVWGCEAFGMPFHDNWWQTETGSIMVANFAGMTIRPGSMGRQMPGIEAAIVRRNSDGSAQELHDPDAIGELAIRAGWPSMFRGYLNNEKRYRECFAGEWYLTGDLARRDADGYFWFVGRGDDVIKSAGHLVSPFEVESALLSHAAVAQAAAIGIPDEVAGAVVKAFVELNPGHAAGPALGRELLAHARQRLGPAIAPREIAFLDTLPRTRSGKIMRRVLRARELGLPEGDLSTLEGGG